MTDKPRTATPYDWLEDADEELRVIAKQHARDYEMEQLDRELGLTEPQSGRGLLLAAEADLKSRGIVPDTASKDEMAEALLRMSP
jgi:hypothetical protein